MAIIRVLAIVVGDDTTVFYKEDGETIDLPSSDPRIPGIVAAATPVIAAGQVAEVNFENVTTTHYRDFEEKTGGLVKLFRVAKKFVQHIFAEPEPEKPAPQVIGVVPVPTSNPAIPSGMVKDSTGITAGGGNVEAPFKLERPAIEGIKDSSLTHADKLNKAAQEILSNAQSVNHPDFTDDETKDDDTIIAVVEHQGEQVVIPGIENLKDHMAIALKLGSTIGVQRFLERIAPVISKRGHSIDDLLRFMSRNDMPIADDGCIVAFKTLNQRGSHADEFVDIHSGNVVQRVGSKVFMKENMVDPNRRNDCSNGLHVARRAYVGGFRSGTGVMVLIKVAPEDAIAVPQYDSNKMRVCGYHIVGFVPKSDHSTVYSDSPLSKDSRAAKLVGAVLRGEHIGVIETVEIGGSKGSNLKITKLGSEAQNRQELRAAEQKINAAVPVASIDDAKDGAQGAKVDPKEVAAQVTEAKAVASTGKAGQARLLYNSARWDELLALKKAAKKSWEALGFTDTEMVIIKTQSEREPLPKPVTPVKPVKTAPKGLAPAKIPASEIPSKMEQDFGTKKTEPEPPVQSGKVPTAKELNMTGTRAEVARQLFDQATGTGSAEGKPADRSRWGTLWRHQKECKKSWAILGFTPKEIERIKTNKPDWV